MRVISSLDTALTPTAVALGNFDGIHLGHQQVIAPILQKAIAAEPVAVEQQPVVERQNAPPSFSLAIPKEEIASQVDGKISYPHITVATFDPHPREFFSGVACKLLTPRAEKVQQLNRIGVEQLVLLPFDRELAALTPKQFVEEILLRQLRVQHVSVGEDFRFGHRRAGTAADLLEIASTYGVKVTIVPLHTSEGERISSSAIRKSLEQGELNQVNRLLGRPYTLTGVVIKGQSLGRTIGFPTANLQLPPDKFLPKQGVYCVRVWGPSLSSPASPISGVMNIGKRPTVNGSSLTVEFHLLDWLGDLYGQTLTVSLEKFLRAEQKFPSLDALKNQIQADCAAARAFFR
ncbi:MAG: bifunctional riboflavin kinase/FAD synthetase [Symploca sp. SIO2E9]|nr:bifunctional riboflavin kinase/FAD synthetase [Symploca sp. SIO2E9]